MRHQYNYVPNTTYFATYYVANTTYYIILPHKLFENIIFCFNDELRALLSFLIIFFSYLLHMLACLGTYY